MVKRFLFFLEKSVDSGAVVAFEKQGGRKGRPVSRRSLDARTLKVNVFFSPKSETSWRSESGGHG